MQRTSFRLQLRQRELRLGGQTLIMGILNVTPDSFSERGRYFDRHAAIAHGREMARDGADIIDIGGESTRPGATPVAMEEEMDRTIPVVEALRRKGLKIPISIDTHKAAVAERAILAGAEIINDVSGLRFDPAMPAIARRHRAALILMHLRGTPQTMQQLPPVRNIVAAVRQGLRWSVQTALKAGIRKNQIVLDPGIGFGKTVEQNYELIAALPRLSQLGFPLLAGPSRKSFLRKTLEAFPSATRASKPPSPDELLCATAAAVAACILRGAQIVRVHDVRQMAAVARIADQLPV